MRVDEINENLKKTSFYFFYKFSRFEFALKENQFLKYKRVGSNAEPGWNDFVEKYFEKFKHTDETRKLLSLNPKEQCVGANKTLEWRNISIESEKGKPFKESDLYRVVLSLKTVRNNLFHGGKQGADGWDDPERTKELLEIGQYILDHLARMADIEADYTHFY